MAVALVTDSTAYLPPHLADQTGIRVVPLQVVIGGAAYDEGVSVDPAAVADALRRYTPVSTSRPSPQALLAAYRAAARDGAEAVLSIHLSAQVSGTVQAAELAAREAEIPVRVVDSRSLALGLGFAVLAAARAASRGEADLDVLSALAHRVAGDALVVFGVDTLEHLRRGGRIGSAQALVGSALAVKPLLRMVDGHIEPLDRVRTWSRAMARLEDLAVGHAGDRPVDVAVHHLDAAQRADVLAARLRARLPQTRVLLSEVGAVVGAHVGPGTVGVVVAPRG